MKLLLFFIIIFIIYILAILIKVTHVNQLPQNEKTEIETRSKIRSMLMHNHIKCQQPNVEHFTDVSKKKKRESPHELLEIIKDEYLDQNYKFNIIGLPVTTRNFNNSPIDKKYIYHIRNNINEWNHLSDKIIELLNIKLVFIQETENEFLIKVNVKILYAKKTMHLSLCYHGRIERTDDPINLGNDVYIFQLVDIKPLSRNDFDTKHLISNQFITMEDQLKYVDRINQMHNNEMNH